MAVTRDGEMLRGRFDASLTVESMTREEVRAASVDSDRNAQYGPRTRQGMAKTVDDLRNEIREAVGRYERIESTAFTKEALAAICEAFDYEVGEGRLPPKAEMRAAIRQRVDGLEEVGDRPFRKAELEAIAAALREST